MVEIAGRYATIEKLKDQLKLAKGMWRMASKAGPNKEVSTS